MSTFTGQKSSASVIAERNARLFAEQQRLRRGPTLEFNFTKRIDNSRLVKAPDTVRIHEMRMFTIAMGFLLTLAMAYGWQHFKSIQVGYTVEREKQQLEQLKEENRHLRLEEAQLTQPGRIDAMARELGMVERQPGQVVRSGEQPDVTVPANGNAPALAQVLPQDAALVVR